MRPTALYSFLCAAMVLGGAVSSRAAVQENTKTPFVSIDYVPCANGGAGETVHFSGIQHTLGTYTVAGDKATGLFMTSLQDARAVGDTTGDVYVATGKIGSVLKVSLKDGSGSQTLQGTVHFIGKDSAAKLAMHENLRIVINADGSVDVLVDNVNITCR